MGPDFNNKHKMREREIAISVTLQIQNGMAGDRVSLKQRPVLGMGWIIFGKVASLWYVRIITLYLLVIILYISLLIVSSWRVKTTCNLILSPPY